MQAGAAKAATRCGRPGWGSSSIWENQIQVFRDGAWTDVSMQPFVANLTDEDVTDLAAYYAGLSPCP